MNGTFIANQYISSRSRNIRTLITFDNGAEWHLLEAPEITSDGKETDCEVVCAKALCPMQYVAFYIGCSFFIASLFPPPSNGFNRFQSFRSVFS